jgi:DNA-binding response OmpR family regulator
VLIIDDDRELGALLTAYLAKFGIKAITAEHPDIGLKLFHKHHPSLVILDIMLPDRDGFEVCREIRREASTPVIMLTARGEVSDKVVGLELGADDYLAKPFDPRELVARIQTVLRRSHPHAGAQGRLKSGPLLLDPARRSASLKGKDLDLTTTEFEILGLLMSAPGQVVKRDDIIKRLRGEEAEAFNRSVDLAVSRLRAKLGDSGKEQHFIKTAWGTGYVFSGKVECHD